jgi:Xaa-Pro aminopeptidase
LDALIATHPNHVTYASNYGGHSPRIYQDRMVFAIVPADLDAAILAPIGDAPYFAANRASIWVPEIWTYGTSKITWPEDLQPDADERCLIDIIQDRDHNAKTLPDLIARVLERKGLAKATIGLDESGIGVEMYEKILKACPNATFRPASEIWRDIELIKTGEELDRLRKGALANDAAVAAALSRVRAGVSEAELLQAYNLEVTRRGGVLEFWNSAGGRRGGGFFPSGTYRLQKGDLYRYDAGMVLDHYHADTGGVCVLGEPTQRQREIYGAITAGMEAACAVVRPGSTYEDVWRAGVTAVTQAGIPKYDLLRPDLGHGIGIEPRVPGIAKGNLMPLAAGMIINVEVPYYEIGYGGFQIEYTLLVTPAGYELLIPGKRELQVVEP